MRAAAMRECPLERSSRVEERQIAYHLDGIGGLSRMVVGESLAVVSSLEAVCASFSPAFVGSAPVGASANRQNHGVTQSLPSAQTFHDHLEEFIHQYAQW